MFRFPSISRIHASVERERSTHRHCVSAFTLLALVFGLAMTFGTLSFAAPSALAKDAGGVSLYQGLILQVDRTNSKDVSFSLLDNHGISHTIHLTANTQFAPHQSASQVSANMLVAVKVRSGAAGQLVATWIQVKGKNQGAVTLQGVVAAVNQNQKTIALALNDGTILTITITHASLSHMQTGATLSLKANFAGNGSLSASTYRQLASHASSFQARGVISNINTRTHSVTLVSPSGAAFSVVQKQNQSSHNASTLHVGEKVVTSGSVDSHGNLNAQSVTVVTANAQQLTIEGMVSAIDTNGGTLSLVDEEGNVSTLNASSDLLNAIQVGGIYQIEVSVGSDGSLTALQILATIGNDQGGSITLQGTVQFYDDNSGLLNMSTCDGQSFTLTVSNQTQIVNSSGATASLARGQEIRALVQLHANGSYSVFKIVILDGSGPVPNVTYIGFFDNYDDASQQLTIDIGNQGTLTFTVDDNTRIRGVYSLDDIIPGSYMKIEAQVQPDGSYLAVMVRVPDNGWGDSGKHHSR